MEYPTVKDFTGCGLQSAQHGTPGIESNLCGYPPVTLIAWKAADVGGTVDN